MIRVIRFLRYCASSFIYWCLCRCLWLPTTWRLPAWISNFSKILSTFNLSCWQPVALLQHWTGWTKSICWVCCGISIVCIAFPCSIIEVIKHQVNIFVFIWNQMIFDIRFIWKLKFYFPISKLGSCFFLLRIVSNLKMLFFKLPKSRLVHFGLRLLRKICSSSSKINFDTSWAFLIGDFWRIVLMRLL